MSRRRKSSCFLASLPEIVEAILRLLPAKALLTASRVNRLWFEISNQILHERSQSVVKFFENTLITSEEVEKLFDDLIVYPEVIFLFSQRESWLMRRDPDAKRIEERHLARTINILARRKPQHCILLGCTTERVLVEEREPISRERHLYHKRQGHGLMFLPRVQGVDYHHVYLRQSKPHRGQSWSDMFDLGRATPVKLVILIALSHSRENIPHIAAGIRCTYGPRVVILGAVAHDRVFFDGMIKRTRVTALFISGTSFRACAKFINNDRDSRFYERISTLTEESRAEGFEPLFNIAITSRFVSRGNAFYINSMSALDRPISETPTIGIYSFGEFCLSSTDVGKTRPNTCKRYMRHNAAIFCACSCKKERNAAGLSSTQISRPVN